MLDTFLLSAVLFPNQETHRLEAIAERLGVSVMGRTSDGWQKLDTGGALCEMLLHGKDANGAAVEVELMLPLGMILLVVSVRHDGAAFGFRARESLQ